MYVCVMSGQEFILKLGRRIHSVHWHGSTSEYNNCLKHSLLLSFSCYFGKKKTPNMTEICCRFLPCTFTAYNMLRCLKIDGKMFIVLTAFDVMMMCVIPQTLRLSLSAELSSQNSTFCD